MKKALSYLLAVSIIMGMVPIQVFAGDTNEVASDCFEDENDIAILDDIEDLTIETEDDADKIEDDNVKEDEVPTTFYDDEILNTGEIVLPPDEDLDFSEFDSESEIAEKSVEDLEMLQSEEQETEISTEELQFAARFLEKSVDDISEAYILYDIDDLPSYILVDFSDGGYLIFRRDNLKVFEFSTNAHSPYEGYKEDLYYIGLLQYAYRDDEDLFFVGTDEEITSIQKREALQINEEYTRLAEKEQRRSINTVDTSSDPTIITNADKIRNTNFGKNSSDNKYDKYPTGSCGPLAISILMEYFDDNVDEDFVPSNLETTFHKDDTLHDHFRRNVALTQTAGGSMPEDDARTLNYWLGQNDTRNELGYHAKYNTVLTDELRNQILQGNPGLLYLFNDSVFGNHVVVAYGCKTVFLYPETGQGATLYFLIHPGWHNYCLSEDGNDQGTMSDIYVAADVSFGGSAWLEEYSLHQHNFNVPVMYQGTEILHDETNHYMKCTSCNLIVAQEHNLRAMTFGNSNRHYWECTLCGYKTPECTNITLKSYDDLTHFGYCDRCNIPNINKQNHAIKYRKLSLNKHEKSCSGCTLNKMESCTFSALWSGKNDSGHTKDCTYCGNVTTEAHKFGAYMKNTAQHSRNCLICQYTQTQSHSMGNYSYNSTKHYKTCSVCGYEDSGSHILTGGYTWIKVGTMLECRKKERSCITCGGKFVEVDKNHTIDSKTKKCTKCGYYRGY